MKIIEFYAQSEIYLKILDNFCKNMNKNVIIKLNINT